MSESVQAIPPFLDASPARLSHTTRPSTREWTLHSLLFLATAVSTTFAGIAIAAPTIEPPPPPLSSAVDYVLYIPSYYLGTITALLSYVLLNPHLIIEGVMFSLALLAILASHEMGHYIACRCYGVTATLPFFIPAPPLFLAGTLGAFIKIKSPIPSRRALFDIGLAGPLAGFVVTFPIALAGMLTLQASPPVTGHAITFNDPLLLRLLASATGVQLADASPNPFYMAAWIGLLVTSLNLMPVGQLDGGHGTFAVFAEKPHRIIGRTAFVIVAVTAVLGFLWHGSPSGFLYALLLGIMLKVRHPQPEQMEPLGTTRVIIAIFTLLVFLLSFHPFPITIS